MDPRLSQRLTYQRNTARRRWHRVEDPQESESCGRATAMTQRDNWIEARRRWPCEIPRKWSFLRM